MREKLIRHELVVIGGGPAGAAAAILLARAGREVLLLEREALPRDKVCGEFLSWEALRYLAALGLDLPALGAPGLRRLRLSSGTVQVEAELPFAAAGLSRRRLDEALLREARRAGADVRRGTGVKALAAPAGGNWRLCLSSGETLAADTVMLASGKRDLGDWARPGRDATRIGFKMHLALAPGQREDLREAVEIAGFDGGYAGLLGVEEDRTTLCCLVGKAAWAGCGKRWSGLLDWLAAASPTVARRLAGACSLWPRPLAVAGTPYGYLHGPAAPPGLFRLGDQAAVIPSFAGDGIAMALHSAFLAARSLLDGEDAAVYYRRLRRDFRKPLRRARLLDRMSATELGRHTILTASRLSPALLNAAMQGTRLRVLAGLQGKCRR